MSRANTVFCPTLREAFERAGMRYPDKDMAPGSLVRFSTDDGKTGDLAGWCKSSPMASAPSLAATEPGTKFTWQMRDTDAPKPSNEELQAARLKSHQARQQADADLAKQHASAAATAARIWSEASEVDLAHSYVRRKGITPYGARQDLDGSLVLAVRGPDGEIQSVQFIGVGGVKRFLPKAKMKGGRLILGNLENGKPIILAEGWATACSIHEATGQAVVVGFSGSNMAVVAADLRRKFPDSPLRIAGDLDDHGKGLSMHRPPRPAGAPAVLIHARVRRRPDARATGTTCIRPKGSTQYAGNWTRRQTRQRLTIVPFLAPALAKCDARDGTYNTRPLTELGNALRLLDDNGDHLKYVPEVKAWLIWTGKSWQWDPDGAAVRSMAAPIAQDHLR
jgi:phage/plasmid primase-like uncharacterized protein